MDLQMRPAKLEDAAFLVPLINEADGEMPFHIWSSLALPRADPWEVGLRRVQSDDPPVSWRMAWITEAEGQRVGAVIVHQFAETPEQLEATSCRRSGFRSSNWGFSPPTALTSRL